MKTIDLTKVYRDYKGKWVALKDDQKTVISSAKTLEEAAQLAEKKGFKNPIFMQIPPKLTYIVG
jgi:hypothetical protein